MKTSIIRFLLIITFISCGGGDDEIIPPAPSPQNPVATQLSFPANNSECLEGTEKTATESTVTFEWNTAQHTDSYELVLKNLESDIITNQSTTTTKLSIKLLRGTPYSWYVISKSTSVSPTATSQTWKFYNAGEATVSYAPFPAEVVSPAKGVSVTSTEGKITLDWNASDVDNDIDLYDVYFGTATTPPSFKTGLTDSVITDVDVSSGTTYNWYVITKDIQGNSSKSETFMFSVN